MLQPGSPAEQDDGRRGAEAFSRKTWKVRVSVEKKNWDIPHGDVQ